MAGEPTAGTAASGGFAPWRLAWTPEHVRRFWDWWGRRPAAARKYFSGLVGRSVVDQVQRVVPVGGNVVDWGAGPGFLVEWIMRAGARRVWALDASPESVAALRERFAGRPQFAGAHASASGEEPLPDGLADLVFLVETVEHLDDASLARTLAEVQRVLKPDGYLVITTPNREQLDLLEVMCPACGCIFHSTQHVRSFSARSLGALLADYGFREVVCRSTLFSEHTGVLGLVDRARYTLRRREPPHLLYVGTRG